MFHFSRVENSQTNNMNTFSLNVKPPKWVRRLFAKGVWKLDTPNTVYLTFDDGPTPVVTEFVLDTLKQYQAKATFFCVGKNIKSYPEILKKIIDAQHTIGNHSMTHLNGWKADNETYFKEIEACEILLNQFLPEQKSKLFRPPYGRITPLQMKVVAATHKVIFWDVLSGDFNNNLKADDIINNVIRHTEPGSIIVFHDSEKAFPHLKIALPAVLEYLKQKGFLLERLAR